MGSAAHGDGGSSIKRNKIYGAGLSNLRRRQRKNRGLISVPTQPLEKSRSEEVQRQLDSLREKLLDLTFRNRALNHRPDRPRLIKIVDELPEEVFRILVLDKKTMSFAPKPDSDIGEYEDSEADLLETEESLESQPWELPPPEEELEDKHIDSVLQTPYDRQMLDNRLVHVNQKAQEFLDEQGYNALFLAITFLKWPEEGESSQSRRAPLLLIPVELKRARAVGSFRVLWSDEEIHTNLSLREKLRREFNIELPTFEMPEKDQETSQYLSKYLDVVRKVIKGRQDWSLTSDIYLDFFNFKKFVMYKDLDPATWPKESPPSLNPLVQQVLHPTGDEEHVDNFDETTIDTALDWKNVYHILDADPSQIAVIEMAKAKRNLVVEGPPGTGKSQTIANLIAELLAKGQKVLFVSEKMAALEVVKSRLDSAKLGSVLLLMELDSLEPDIRDYVQSRRYHDYGSRKAYAQAIFV